MSRSGNPLKTPMSKMHSCHGWLRESKRSVLQEANACLVGSTPSDDCILGYTVCLCPITRTPGSYGLQLFQTDSSSISTSPRENLIAGFLNMLDSNRPVSPQRLDRDSKLIREKRHRAFTIFINAENNKS